MSNSADFTPPRPLLIRLRNALVLTAAVVAVGTAAIAGGPKTYSLVMCGFGELTREGEECVGATDLTDLDPNDPNDSHFDLGPIERAIASQNKAVLEEKQKDPSTPVVSIAVLMPMRAEAGSPQSTAQIRDHLAGAYVAQKWANEGSLPKIRLVIAHEGIDGTKWETPVSQLIDMVDDPQYPLVAVTGMGISTQDTIRKADVLDDKGIPMLGSVITADKINRELPHDIDNFTRVTSTNSRQIETIKQYTDQIFPAAKPIGFKDVKESDLYTSGLHTAFEKYYEITHWEPFNSGKPHGQTTLANKASEVCETSLVAYAGRTSLLPVFIDRIRNEVTCDHPITVITASDGGQLVKNFAEEDDNTAVKLIYAAHLAPTDTPCDFRTEVKSVDAGAGLDTGWAAMAYDAMWSAIDATREAFSNSGIVPSFDDVSPEIQEIVGVTGRFPIDHASGNVNRPVHVMALSSGRSPELVHGESTPKNCE